MLQVILLQCSSAIPSQSPKMGCVCSHPAVMISLILAIALFLCVLLVLCYLHCRNKMKKEMAEKELEHEIKMKEKAFEQEQVWAGFKELSASTDESLKKRIEEMGQSISSLSSQLEHEKENNDLTKKMLSYYQECFKQLKVRIVADYKEPAADDKEKAVDDEEPAADNEETVTDDKEQ